MGTIPVSKYALLRRLKTRSVVARPRHFRPGWRERSRNYGTTLKRTTRVIFIIELVKMFFLISSVSSAMKSKLSEEEEARKRKEEEMKRRMEEQQAEGAARSGWR